MFQGRDVVFGMVKPRVGVREKEVLDNKVWMRVLGLSLHLWAFKIFKFLGDACRGFVEVDKETTLRTI